MLWEAFGGEDLWFLLLVTVDQEVSDGLGSASSLVRFSPLVLGVQLGGGKVVRLGGVGGGRKSGRWVQNRPGCPTCLNPSGTG